MRWIGAVVWRSAKFWGVWIALVGLACCTFSGTELDGASWGRVGRLTLFVSTVLLLFGEWSLLNRTVLAFEAKLRAYALPVPSRWERVTHGCLPVVASGLFWVSCLCVASPWVHDVVARDADVGLPLLLLAGLAWSAASLLVCTLALGGLTLARFSWAARKVPPSDRPSGPVAVPWVVSAWSACALLLALVGLPSPDLAGAILQALLTAPKSAVVRSRPPAASPRPAAAGRDTGVVRVRTTGPKTSPGVAASDQIELLLELGADDTIGEVQPVLDSMRASYTPAFPDVAIYEDPELAATWLVTAPPVESLVLIFALLSDQENVRSLELNAAVSATPLGATPCGRSLPRLPVDDPYGQPELGVMGADRFFTLLDGRSPSRPALVAIVDTGVDGTHEDLRSVMRPMAISDDRQGHGTAVAGLAGAIAHNGRGVASHNLRGRFVTLRSYPALAAPNAGVDDVVHAIVDASDHGADVVNLSFGARGDPPRALVEAVGYARARGAVVVAAAGNDGAVATRQWPANVPGVLVVGATDTSGGRARYSNTTSGVTGVAAPGELCSTGGGGAYGRVSGTSAAAPLVSGLLGTLRAVCPSLTVSEAEALLVSTGDSLGQGLGPRVRSDRALEALWVMHPECGRGW